MNVFEIWAQENVFLTATMNSSDPYQSTSLNSSRKEIRLLELQPGPDGSDLIGRLERWAIGNTPPYEALSYTWGPSHKSERIVIEQAELCITDNLASALCILRSRDRERKIWIDAICINQKNTKERNEQVALMRSVYRNAELVVVWISVELDISCLAVQKLREMNNRSVMADLGQDATIWDKLKPLFMNSYWNRVWIQQEISSASSLVFQVTNTTISSYSMFHFIRLFDERATEKDQNSSAWFDWVDASPKIHLPPRFGEVDSSTKPISGSTLDNKDLGLLSVLEKSYKLKCTDDRDRVYGLLYLSADYQEGDIEVNYDFSLLQVFASIPHFVLQRYKSLNFLLSAGLCKTPHSDLSKSQISIPSWIPDWTQAPSRMHVSEGFGTSMNIPPIISSFQPAIDMTRKSLHAYGIHIATISKITQIPTGMEFYELPIATFTDLCWSIIRMSLSTSLQIPPDQLEDSDLQPQWQALVRALVQIDHYYPEDQDKYEYFRDTVISKSANSLQELSLNPGDRNLIESNMMALIVQAKLHFPNDCGQTFVRLMYTSLIKHAPFVGLRGEIGISPISSVSGDEAWNVFGCDKVLIMRPRGKYHEVVGEGYIEGYVRGEVLPDLSGDLNVGDTIHGCVVQQIELR